MKVDAGNLKIFLDTMATAGDDVSIFPKGGYAVSRSVDEAGVMMVECRMPFSGDGEEVAFIAKRIRKLIPITGMVDIYVDGDYVVLSSEQKTIKARKLVDIKSIKFPELDYTASGVVSVLEFVDMVRSANVIKGDMNFMVKDGGGTLKVVGDIETVEFDFAGRGNGGGVYSSGYMAKIAEVIGKYFKDSIIELGFGKNIPIKVEVEGDNVRCIWFLASRVV